jgi:DNA-binding PadR family transcriptional regulator
MQRRREEMIVLSSLQEDLLNIFAERCPEGSTGMFGLEIIDNFNKVAVENNRRKIGVGSLYPALRQLELQGLIVGRDADRQGNEKSHGARRRYYTITGKGKEVLDKMIAFRLQLRGSESDISPQLGVVL